MDKDCLINYINDKLTQMETSKEHGYYERKSLLLLLDSEFKKDYASGLSSTWSNYSKTFRAVIMFYYMKHIWLDEVKRLMTEASKSYGVPVDDLILLYYTSKTIGDFNFDVNKLSDKLIMEKQKCNE